ncbi:hypothetical protein K431DRAFT_211322, partial [Polychaeton citri CBS 116435]
FLAALTTVALHIHRDYKAYLSLGPGGTPQTFSGYLKVTLLGLFALRNPFTPPSAANGLTGYLLELPLRLGPQPETAGIAPHRQRTQRIEAGLFHHLNGELRQLAQATPGLIVGKSCFEKHSIGIFSQSPRRKTCNGEVCHTHSIDGSMHATLHPADLKMALETGWVVRHPLARGGWFSRFVPRDFVMIYAPRSIQEVDVVLEIVKAAAHYVSG